MISSHTHKGIQSLSPYEPGKPIEEVVRLYGVQNVIKLASNENAFGPTPLLNEALNDLPEKVLRYPDGNGFKLKQALASHHGIQTNQITLGNGSNDILDMVARVFLQTGRSALFSQFAFVVYFIAAKSVNAPLQVIDSKNYGFDLKASLNAINEQTGVIFIANPNNPTGSFIDQNDLFSFLEQVPKTTFVVLDEAYSEYIEQARAYDSVPWLDQFPNLIISRTFSKAYALAGLRVGYALASTAITDLLNRIRHPFNVNALALECAEIALADQAWIQSCMSKHHQCKRNLEDALKNLKLNWMPSQANFLTIYFGENAFELEQQLLKRGIIVRGLEAYGLPEHLRVSIGTEQENQSFVSTLKSLL